MDKQSSKDVMLPHSQAKVEFYEKYLERYLAIMNASKWFNAINIYDVFCGRGVYKNGGLGSPIRAVDVIIRTCKSRSTGTRYNLFLNDIEKQNTDSVNSYITLNFPDYQTYCKIQYSNNRAEDELITLCRKLFITPSNERNLIFIDPYGYKEIKKDTINNLMLNGKTEIILFLPISFMYRFSNYAFDENAHKSSLPLRNFISSFFEEGHPIRNDEEMDVLQYIRYLTDAFSFNGRYFATSYHIERDANSYFALFFISPNIYGFEKVMETKWALDEADGNGFHLPEDQPGLFDDFELKERQNEKASELENALINYLSSGRKKNSEIYNFVLQHEFLPRHANAILRKLQNEKRINVSYIGKGEKVNKGTFLLNYDGYKNPKVYIELAK